MATTSQSITDEQIARHMHLVAQLDPETVTRLTRFKAAYNVEAQSQGECQGRFSRAEARGIVFVVWRLSDEIGERREALSIPDSRRLL
jgi:hypothetical protein